MMDQGTKKEHGQQQHNEEIGNIGNAEKPHHYIELWKGCVPPPADM